MARGPRRTVTEKITEKEELITNLQVRMKSEQKELEGLYRERRNENLESLDELISLSGVSLEEATRVLQEYIDIKELQTA